MRKLIVEGTDDQHVIWSLLGRRDFPAVFEIQQMGGYNTLLQALPVQLKASGLERLGIVIDADVDAQNRWNKVRSAFLKSGVANFPLNPVPGGTVIVHDSIRIGTWLMPDNIATGMLEDFVQKLVPNGDLIWPESTKFVHALPASNARYKECHLSKSCIHTWLAVQDTPGSPMGQAITKKMLKADGPDADAFIDWLDRLFVVE